MNDLVTAKMRTNRQVLEDVWIPTQCGMCYAECGIKVRRINGVVTKIEGNEETWMGARGGLCGKGVAGLQFLYDPNRVNYPLRRTNPKKGLYEQPQWKRISWEEALTEIQDATDAIDKIQKTAVGTNVALDDYYKDMKIQPGEAGAVDAMTPDGVQKAMLGIRTGESSFVYKNGELYAVRNNEVHWGTD